MLLRDHIRRLCETVAAKLGNASDRMYRIAEHMAGDEPEHTEEALPERPVMLSEKARQMVEEGASPVPPAQQTPKQTKPLKGSLRERAQRQ